jgi:hypothetical protein
MPTDLDFDRWVQHVFDHPVANPQWYFQIGQEAWDGGPLLTVQHVTRLFESPEQLLKDYSREQLEQGLWYLDGEGYLNDEYAEMCRRLATALARRQPTPLKRGRENVWACGIVRTIGWANMLDDSKSRPYMKLIDIDPEFGVANSTGQGKSMAIKRMFGIGRLEPDWTLPSRLGDNPVVWKVWIGEELVDIRQESREEQVEIGMQSGPTSGEDVGAQNGPTVVASAWGCSMFEGQTWNTRDSGGEDVNGGQIRANPSGASRWHVDSRDRPEVSSFTA